MIRKEQLLRIYELRLSGILNAMTDSQFSNYIQLLNKFIDNFPNYADSLTKALEARQYSLLESRLSELHDILTKIHANALAEECQKQRKLLANASQKSIDQDELEASVEDLIQRISALSIEVQMAAHKSATASAEIRVASRKFNKGSILAVDNAVMFLNTLKKLLAGTTYDLHCVTTGADALKFLESNKPGVILLDIEMPDMDGYELARRIKKSGNNTPIVFITANSAREYVDKAAGVGATGLLMKPLRINQLLEKLKEIM